MVDDTPIPETPTEKPQEFLPEAERAPEPFPTWEAPPPPVAPPAPIMPLAEQVPVAEQVLDALPVDETPVLLSPQEWCPQCRAPRGDNQPYCGECGWVYPKGNSTGYHTFVSRPARIQGRLKVRYQMGAFLGERLGVERYLGSDHGAEGGVIVPVMIARSPLPKLAEQPPELPPPPGPETPDGEILPTFEDVPLPAAEIAGETAWPSTTWDAAAFSSCPHTTLPVVLDAFVQEGFEYLILEIPRGRSLWDAWDDPNTTNEVKFRWLRDVAEALHELHRAGAVAVELRPDMVLITDEGKARLSDLPDMVPLPMPKIVPVRGTHYTAPELVLCPELADARSDLFCFGAMLCALYLGRELTDMDYESERGPKPMLARFPDMHPALGRLLGKTFQRDVELRLPTEEGARQDPTGFVELLRTLDQVGQALDDVRFDVAAWTTTGMIRSNNEDAFTLLHSMDAKQDDIGDIVLAVLADGMGGYEAGEVAAAMSVSTIRSFLLSKPMFGGLTGNTLREAFDLDACKALILESLKEANRQIWNAASAGIGRRGMGCTTEVICLHGRHLVVGHVGDSRTYHLEQGRLVQVTRDQTLVNRLVDIGALSPEDALIHPRRSELYQAVGGRPEVDALLYHAVLKPGDWVVVCSDGLSNEMSSDELKEMLYAEARSADMAARRLVNYVNVVIGRDNATVVVVRVV